MESAGWAACHFGLHTGWVLRLKDISDRCGRMSFQEVATEADPAAVHAPHAPSVARQRSLARTVSWAAPTTAVDVEV